MFWKRFLSCHNEKTLFCVYPYVKFRCPYVVDKGYIKESKKVHPKCRFKVEIHQIKENYGSNKFFQRVRIP